MSNQYAAARPDDYESFAYLAGHYDLPAFELVAPSVRRSKYAPELSTDQEERVERLMSGLIISFHDHPQMLPTDLTEIFDYLRSLREYTAYTELRSSGLSAVFDNLVGVIGSMSPAGWKWDDTISALGMRLADLAHRDDATVIHRSQDLLDAHRDGKLGFVLGTESAGMIENELDRLDVLYGFGIRQMGLVYADSNTLGSGQKEARDAGLTAFGRKAVQRMNDLGILIDVSHASDQTSLDAIETSAVPIAVTHAGARGVWPIPRLKSDEVLKALAERGGVLGLEAAPHTTISHEHNVHSIESVMDHFAYAVELMGIEHVAFGPDTIYGDHVAFHGVMSSHLDLGRMREDGNLDFETVDYVDGLENPTETFGNIASWLVQHGYSDSEIEAVMGGNILRLVQEVWR